MRVTSKILSKDFEFSTSHVALLVDKNLWQHDKWIVVINDQVFEYHTGIGHRIPKSRFDKKEFDRIKRINPIKEINNLIVHNSQIKAVSKLKPLDIDDVLYSLLIDSEANDYSFQDWCNNFGYDVDSIKAMNMYNDCISTYNKVRTFITDFDKARELFQDY